MQELEKDIVLLKKMIQEFFFDKVDYSEEMRKFNQKNTIFLLKSLGYETVDTNLLQNIVLGKEDAHLRSLFSSKKEKPSKYETYLKGNISDVDLHYLISRYLYNRNNPLFPKEDLEELKELLNVLFERKGRKKEDITDDFLKKYLNHNYNQGLKL